MTKLTAIALIFSLFCFALLVAKTEQYIDGNIVSQQTDKQPSHRGLGR